MPTQARLFNKHDFGKMEWPQTVDGSYAKRFMFPFFDHGTEYMIPNVQTSLYALQLDESHILPVTVNHEEYESSYVTSPYTHYVSYAKEELYLLRSPLTERLLKGLLAGMGAMLRASRFNQAVHVNNWLVSTNLYPELTRDQVMSSVALILQSFPSHTLIFRSLNRTTNQQLMLDLRAIGFRFVPSRQIYFLRPSDPSTMNAKARWLVKRDYALIAAHDYEVLRHDQLTDADIPRIAQLYQALYLDKYSYYNPQFGIPFLSHALREHVLHFEALRHRGTGVIDAVLGYFCRNGVMTTPIFGYDTSKDQRIGLYRMLSAMLLDIARQNGHLLHESSGAAQFKRNRGAFADIEYSAVYDAHLPFYRRMGWSFLQKVLDGIGIPLLRKYKL
ncbi:GNAT family N-acetyltransferase [Paenibacillus hexagrammi]|uniref:GNAT family N-acetyltransferase n=1 Tax=Paenibacillus hexagrammi TaxID=2908839 RepID=A0ABY3SPS4_9BACL|nr:GNAT family N-acetyltransferase [Paenibacillus sp. YPD9-1]UJF34977.1 GNAT family N-acetyltransferase [Paenibacillus sp. YPD9-1]